MLTEFVPTDERDGSAVPAAADDGPHPVAVQCRRADAAHRQQPSGTTRTCSRSIPFDAESRGVRDGDLVSLQSRVGEIALHAQISERMQPGVVYTTFHHPNTGANVVTTEYSDWATNCPEYKVTAVQVRRTNHYSEWQEQRPRGRILAAPHRGEARRCRRVTRPALVRRAARASTATTHGAVGRLSARETSPSETPIEYRVRRRAVRGDDGDARRSRGFRDRLRADRGDHRDAEPKSAPSRSSAPTKGCASTSR